MKKIFFLSIIALQGLMVQAQTPKDSMKIIGFSIEPVVGIGTSEAVQNGTNNLGWKAGCGVVYMFNKHWGISSGLQVEQYSTTVNSGKDSVYIFNPPYWDINSIKATYLFTYLKLPLMVRYISNRDGKIGIFVESGFILDYLIKSNELRTINENDIDTSKQPITYSGGGAVFSESYVQSLGSKTPDAISFNLGGQIAMGVFIPISKRCAFITDFSIDKAFSNVGTSNNDFVNFNGPFYYYNKNNNYKSPEIFNYGTNLSVLFSIHLNIKL